MTSIWSFLSSALLSAPRIHLCHSTQKNDTTPNVLHPSLPPHPLSQLTPSGTQSPILFFIRSHYGLRIYSIHI
ncbi:hypothetical protein BDZ97DRAFT_520823 [Flammula alnicola]|nr:hypothetical protein BDZ97DRAFT_520823 [Flammula alnicola]